MKSTFTLLTALLLAPLATLHAADESAPDVIRVACVGDSITQGVHVGGEDNYPSALQQLLGARYEVRNFGYLCGTVMNIKDRPYMATPEFKKATNYNPHIVIFMLGTNDSKPGEWKQKHGFKTNAFRKFIAIRI